MGLPVWNYEKCLWVKPVAPSQAHKIAEIAGIFLDVHSDWQSSVLARSQMVLSCGFPLNRASQNTMLGKILNTKMDDKTRATPMTKLPPAAWFYIFYSECLAGAKEVSRKACCTLSCAGKRWQKNTIQKTSSTMVGETRRTRCWIEWCRHMWT